MGAEIMTVTMTVAYPAFKSIQALETAEDEEDDKIWLSYWVIFGVITIVDQFFWWALEFIPFYFWLRLGFFMWLFMPQS